MYWDVVGVRAEKNFTLLVMFPDGTIGKVRFLPGHMKGVFEPLKETKFFAWYL